LKARRLGREAHKCWGFDAPGNNDLDRRSRLQPRLVAIRFTPKALALRRKQMA
jgi:hypothetical protein